MKKWFCLVIAAMMSLCAALGSAPAESAAEAMEAVEETNRLQEVFGELAGLKLPTMVILIVLAVMGVLLCMSKKKNWTTRRIAYAGMCIAIAFVLSCIKLFRMPQGGSVTPAAMMPLILFAMACGPVQGVAVGCAFGLLQMVEDFYVIHPLQVLVDYPMAYGATALACLACLLPAKYERLRMSAAVLLGYLGRYAMAVISGAVFFAEYSGGQNAWIYSLGYNLSYLGVEAAIACALSCLPGFGRILRIMKKQM